MSSPLQSLQGLYEETMASLTLTMASVNKLVKDLRARSATIEDAFAEIDRLKKEIEGLKSPPNPCDPTSGYAPGSTYNTVLSMTQGELSMARTVIQKQQKEIEKLKQSRKKNVVR